MATGSCDRILKRGLRQEWPSKSGSQKSQTLWHSSMHVTEPSLLTALWLIRSSRIQRVLMRSMEHKSKKSTCPDIEAQTH